MHLQANAAAISMPSDDAAGTARLGADNNARGVVVGVVGFLALVGASGLALLAAGSLGGHGAEAPTAHEGGIHPAG